MSDSPHVAAARIEVERSRARLMSDIDEIIDRGQSLQETLTPSRLMRDAWEGAKEKGADLAEDAVDAVRSRPLATGGVVAAVTLFLAREPLMDLAAKLLGGSKPKNKDKPKKRRKPSSKADGAKTKDSEEVK
jgi:hypothetical protein